MSANDHATAVELASLPEQVRRFGHVKEEAVARFRAGKARLPGQNTRRRAA